MPHPTRLKDRQFRLGFLLHDVARLRRTVYDKGLKPLGITRSQWWVLVNLVRRGENGITQTELAKVLDIGKVALGGILDRLEANGHVARRPDPTDRRVKHVYMTAAGAALFERIQERATVLNNEMMNGFSADEILFAEALLSKMKQKLIRMTDQKDLEQSQSEEPSEEGLFDSAALVKR